MRSQTLTPVTGDVPLRKLKIKAVIASPTFSLIWKAPKSWWLINSNRAIFLRNNWFSSPYFSINFSKFCVRAKARHKNIPSRGSWPKLSVRKPWIEWKQLLVGQVLLIFLIQCHDVRRSYSSYFICSLIFCYSLGSTRFFKVARAKHRWVTVHCTLLMCSHVQWSS